MALSSEAYDQSVLDTQMLLALAIETSELATGRVLTQAVAGSEFWELGRIVRERSRRTTRAPDGSFEFHGNVEGDLVGLKPDGSLAEVRFVQFAGSSHWPPPMELGEFETRWEEGPFEDNWHFQLLDDANIGNAREEIRKGEWGVVHEESWEKDFVTIVDRRGLGLERALKMLAYRARRATEEGEVVASGSIDLRTDGLYASIGSDSGQFLRFYDDGRVVAVSSTGTPEDVGRWLTWEHAGASKGQFVTAGIHIEFQVNSSAGAVRYRGASLVPKQLRLDSRSAINGNVTQGRLFEFVPIHFLD